MIKKNSQPRLNRGQFSILPGLAKRSGAGNSQPAKGFTLVELLIVIVIIAVLAGILFANLVGVRQRARDSQRKADLRQIQAALELYRSDHGSYPIGTSCPSSGPPTALYFSNSSPPFTGAKCQAAVGGLRSADGNTVYMQKVPCNPLGLGGLYSSSDVNVGINTNASNLDRNYCYSSDGLIYSLITCLENQAEQAGQGGVSSASKPICNGTGTGFVRIFNLNNP
jgi:prepilin-type N-terminal cleavage/methylation domain-containing protein